MIQSIYTQVSNANLVPCNKKEAIKSDPIPLLKHNFLGEYRTALEKAKVRKNLGIADTETMEWGNLFGFIENQKDLVDYVESKWKYTLPDDITNITEELTDVQEAINYALKYVSTFKSDTDSIAFLKDEVKEVNEQISELQSRISNGESNITTIQNSIDTINSNIEILNKSLQAINVDANILEWIKNHTSNSVILTDNGLEVKISEQENNALTLDETGLHVDDFSKQVSDIQTIKENVTTILDTYVTKEQLGGEGDFNFTSQETFENYVNQTNTTITNINQVLDKTVKTGEDGHVDTLYVNQISKNNDNDNIKITNSFEVESGIPLDVRFVVEDLDKLHSLKPNVCYSGMGVVVKNTASLYILREPPSGIIDEEYIKDELGINWKCPEDLVIEVTTQEEYDKKIEEGKINPHIFYYIQEEMVDEPLRDDFATDQEYTEALDKWLRVLQQKYMSAVWGQEIEELVASKASNTAIKSLEEEIQRLQVLINSLSGGSEGVNLKSLNTQVQQNTVALDSLITENGTIPSIQQNLINLQNTVTSDYVTKESITTEDPNVEYIFLKKSEFENYTTTHENQISQQITTQKININGEVLTVEAPDLLFNDAKIALQEQVPVISVLSKQDYDALSQKEENVYYYIHGEEERYILDSEFSEYKTLQSNTITNLSELINTNKNSIGTLSSLTTTNKNTLVLSINEINENLIDVIDKIGDLTSLPEDSTSIAQAIINLHSKINEIANNLTILTDRVSSLEINNS